MPNKYLKLFIGLVFFVFLFSFQKVEADVGFEIQPIKVKHTLNAGESASGIISLINKSDEAVEVEPVLRDFVPMAGTISIQFIERAPGVTTIIDWITLEPAGSFILERGKSKDISYTIQAPANAEPGGHFGTIFFKGTGLKDTGQLKISTQVGTLVFATVPGPNLQKGKISDFSGPKFILGPKNIRDILKRKTPAVNFSLKFENTGTVHFEPKGSIKITNMFGREAGETAIAGQIALPGWVREINSDWVPKGLLFGQYKAKAKIIDGEGNELTTEEISFFTFPLWFVLAFAAAAAIIFFIIKFLKKRIKISVSINK
ncbi:MAG: hypothetical protein A3E90_00680 [Candidatus Portnoybacteria bacterium RIFCSPHIGHO2_12_FULL_40_11]|uniref:Uncharacterized protein n=1 Tax=Candidatus Portnoybacteria bacterium RIFCSPHIGHO2_12_FULL_40_11 TaxID=1801998 RepID=A0A1G2FH88_9BACT|nr:MAG: hypothetical protein A3E90_00680 [Candidatus Portnoybacteria bacterium RIFCSPHIGHO2_12_FULL_40_11]